MMNRAIVPFYILLITVLLSSASEEKAKVEKDMWALVPSVSSIALGTLLQGEVREITVTLTNSAITGNQLIKRVSRSCSCFDVDLSRDNIPVGGSAILKLKLSAGRIDRILNEEVVIQYTNADQKDLNVIRIPIFGKVDSIAAFDPSQLKYELGNDDLVPFTKRVSIRPGTRFSDIKQVALKSNGGFVSTKTTQLKLPKNEPCFDVLIQPEKLQYGRNVSSIDVTMCNSKDEVLLKDQIHCEVFLKPPFSVEPSSFLISDVKNGVSKELVCQITRRSDEPNLETLQVKSSDPDVIKISSVQIESPTRMIVNVEYLKQSDGIFCGYIEFLMSTGHKGSFRIPVVALKAQ